MDNNQNNVFNQPAGQQPSGQPFNGQQFSGQPAGQSFNGQQFSGQPTGQNFNGQQFSGQPAGQNFNGQQFSGQPQQGAFNSQSMRVPANIGLDMISLICSGVGMLMAFLGSLFTCICSASKTYDTIEMTKRLMTGGNMHVTSAVIVVSIIAVIISLVGVVLAITAMKKNPAGKVAKISLALGAFACAYALLPMLTVCGYNCSLNNAING